MRFWYKLLAVTVGITVFLFSEQIIQACSSFNNYDVYPQFYGNTAHDKPAYTPFNFISYDLYYSNYWSDFTELEDGSSEMVKKNVFIKEWQDFSNTNIPSKDIKDFLYNTNFENSNDLKSIANHNQFVQFLLDNKNKSVLNYWLYAKKCENNSLVSYEDWEDNKAVDNYKFTNEQLKNDGLALLKKEKNDFLKMRYAFQILRMSFYDKKYDEVLRLYDELIPANYQDNSIAYARCLGFKAGAYFRKNDMVKAGYYYSKMFDVNDAYKYEAMQSFEWSRMNRHDDSHEIIEDRINKIFKMCQNDHERAVVKVMQGLRAFPGMALDIIEQAYKLDPNVAGIDVLINREINKLESNYFITAIYNQNTLEESPLWYYNYRNFSDFESNNLDSLKRIYGPYIIKLNKFTDKLIVDKKAGTPALWHLTKAYLACMQNKADVMGKELANAENAGMKPSEKSLYKIIDILHTLYKSKKITAQIETELLPKLKDLDNYAKKVEIAGYQFRDIMSNLIAGKYLQQGDTTKAIYAMGHAIAYGKERKKFEASESFLDMQGAVLNKMTIPELKKVQTFRENAQKTAFENWLVSQTYYTPKVLKELEGTKYIRNYDFKNAIKIFEQKGISNEVFGNPFMPQINDKIRLNANDTLRKFTKLTFSKRMAELQDIIAKNPNDAGALYGYAIALYNISYYGKQAEITFYSRISTDENGYYMTESDSKFPREMLEYYRVYTAEQYFNKAAMATKDPEVKAKALWGAAKCWNKRCDMDVDNTYYKNALKSPYFAKLKQEFSNTKYLQNIEGGCEYYYDYLKKR
ncbi:MAG TPA: hypothetical protein VLZ83_14600 [Edaphocola sp.]|nr:hypothetical protein [Edaphocola sp.]